MTGPALKLIWFIDDYHCICILGKECKIWIERRPTYCDRGNFIAKIEPHGDLARDMDNADGWPRYYFDLDRAKLEIEAWLFKRRQHIEPETETLK